MENLIHTVYIDLKEFASEAVSFIVVDGESAKDSSLITILYKNNPLLIIEGSSEQVAAFTLTLEDYIFDEPTYAGLSQECEKLHEELQQSIKRNIKLQNCLATAKKQVVELEKAFKKIQERVSEKETVIRNQSDFRGWA